MFRRLLEIRTETLLRWACFFLLVGRGWVYFMWDAPYREVLYHEGLFGWFIRDFSPLTWNEFASSITFNLWLSRFANFVGVLFALMGFTCIFYRGRAVWFSRLLWLTFGMLVFHAYCEHVELFFRFGHFIEHGIMAMTPLLLRQELFARERVRLNSFLIRFAIALCFLGHGLYAVGYYPVPGRFMDMTMIILTVSPVTAKKLLFCAGVIDFIVAAGVFSPRWIARWLMVDATFWGFVTASARVTMTVGSPLLLSTFLQWLPDTLYRLPHGLIPLILLLRLRPQGDLQDPLPDIP